MHEFKCLHSWRLLINIATVAILVSSLITSTVAFEVSEKEIYYRDSGHNLPEVYNELKSNANIESLELRFVTEGCLGATGPWHFKFQEGDRFPPLKKLSLSNYDLDYRMQWERDNAKWRNSILYKAQKMVGVVTDDLPKPESNLEQWKRAMDFSKLEELYLGHDHDLFYSMMSHSLPSLSNLSISWGSDSVIPNERLNFLSSINPLSSLSICASAPYAYGVNASKVVRNKFPLSTILPRHGAKLESLALNQGESWLNHTRRPMLSLDEIASIKTSCPSLTHLGLDIDRNGTWPVETFQAITSIPTLTSLKLHLEIGADLHVGDPRSFDYQRGETDSIYDDGPFREPKMTKVVADELWTQLQEMKVGKKLNNLEFVVGDWQDLPYLGALYIPGWEDGRAIKFVCKAKEMEEGGSGCVMFGNTFSEDDW